MSSNLFYQGKDIPFEVPSDATSEFLFRLAAGTTGLAQERIRIEYQGESKKVVLQKKDPFVFSSQYVVKDLGPQFNYAHVFYFEYFGPLAIFYLFRLFASESSCYLTLATVLWTIHYAKRILETAFVHSFSHDTMPLFNLFKNCGYYYTCAALISFSVVRYSSDGLSTVQIVGAFGFIVFEALNGYCHIQLKNLRPKGSTAHVLPKGLFFDKIVCPNYTFEILSWFSFWIFSQVCASLLFTIVGAIQMFVWAGQKKARLVREYPEAASRGKISPFPFL